jgi:hypothetical protein
MPGIIIENLKTVYWPIPKNASSSIKRRILEIERKHPYFPSNIHDPEFYKWTNDPIEGYQNFAIVRHPIQRLYSLWKNKIREPHPIGVNYVDDLDLNVFGNYLSLFRSGMSWADFVYAILRTSNNPDPHWATQISQIPNGCEISIYRMESILLRLAFPMLNPSDDQSWQDTDLGSLLDDLLRFYNNDLDLLSISK